MKVPGGFAAALRKVAPRSAHAFLVGGVKLRLSLRRSRSRCSAKVISSSSKSGYEMPLADQSIGNMLMLVNALKAEGITVDSSIEADEANSSAIWVSVGVQR